MNANLKARMQDWWDELEYNDKVELLAKVFPDEAHLIEADEQWNNLDWEERYEVYCAEDAEPDLTEEERYDGGVMSNFDNENPKEVEDYINEGRGRE